MEIAVACLAVTRLYSHILRQSNDGYMHFGPAQTDSSETTRKCISGIGTYGFCIFHFALWIQCISPNTRGLTPTLALISNEIERAMRSRRTHPWTNNTVKNCHSSCYSHTPNPNKINDSWNYSPVIHGCGLVALRS